MKYDKNIPLPETGETKIARFRSMEVGDSFLVLAKEAAAWRVAMSNASATGEFYFISRTVDGGVRFWRRA